MESQCLPPRLLLLGEEQRGWDAERTLGSTPACYLQLCDLEDYFSSYSLTCKTAMLSPALPLTQ